MTTALRVDGISAGYRGVPVLGDVTFDVGSGQVVGLVGPNGAGKSTLLDVICGSLRPEAGRVWLFDRDVTRLPTHRRARLGLGRTFQRLEPFSSLSIADNLLVAAELSATDGRTATLSASSTAATTATAVRGLLRRSGAAADRLSRSEIGCRRALFISASPLFVGGSRSSRRSASQPGQINGTDVHQIDPTWDRCNRR